MHESDFIFQKNELSPGWFFFFAPRELRFILYPEKANIEIHVMCSKPRETIVTSWPRPMRPVLVTRACVDVKKTVLFDGRYEAQCRVILSHC